jgi:hypothetical protein
MTPEMKAKRQAKVARFKTLRAALKRKRVHQGKK